MASTIFVSLMLLAAAQQSQPPLVQQSTGWCSPNIANVTGNVTVNCIGVNPRALKRLNDELDRKNLQLADRVREADEWASRYHSLVAQLESLGQDDERAKRAAQFVEEGNLEAAKKVLDELVSQGENGAVRRVALNHYNRGRVSELQFNTAAALDDYRRACELAAIPYCNEYGRLLTDQGAYSKAVSILKSTLEKEAPTDPTTPDTTAETDHASTLNYLGVLYLEMGSDYAHEADKYLMGALPLRRKITEQQKTDESMLQLANTLNNLGLAHTYQLPLISINPSNDMATQAQKEYAEALDIKRRLARTDPVHYKAELALTLDNFALFHARLKNYEAAKAERLEALDIYTQLAQGNRAYLGDVAITDKNLGDFFDDLGQVAEARKHLEHAEQVFRQLIAQNADAYTKWLALCLVSLAVTYQDKDVPENEQKRIALFTEAFSLYKSLFAQEPRAYADPMVGVAWSLLKELSDSSDWGTYCKVVADAAPAALGNDSMEGFLFWIFVHTKENEGHTCTYQHPPHE